MRTTRPTSRDSTTPSDDGSRRSCPERCPRLSAPVAVVDCGTNSIRLLVQAGSVTLERRMEVTRLGRSIDRTGRLDPEGVDADTRGARPSTGRSIEAHGARAACVRRDASSARGHRRREAFIDAATDVLGQPLDVLTGDDEGRLAFLGATSELDPDFGPFLRARHRRRFERASRSPTSGRCRSPSAACA